MSAIETLDDWNDRLASCGCCQMPVCPIPVLECQSLSGAGFLLGYGGTPGFNEGDSYLSTRQSFQGGGWILYTRDNVIQAELGNEVILPLSAQTITDSKGGYTGALTTTYEGPVSVATARATAYAAMMGALNFTNEDFTLGNSCESSREHPIPWHGAGSHLSFACLLVEVVRYRWQIPADFTGAYFKVTWDILSEPDVGEASLESEGLTCVWTGPGNPEDETDASWFSVWHPLSVPSSPGTKRVVNIRFECYRSPHGHKPQVTGEAFPAA